MLGWLGISSIELICLPPNVVPHCTSDGLLSLRSIGAIAETLTFYPNILLNPARSDFILTAIQTPLDGNLQRTARLPYATHKISDSKDCVEWILDTHIKILPSIWLKSRSKIRVFQIKLLSTTLQPVKWLIFFFLYLLTLNHS